MATSLSLSLSGAAAWAAVAAQPDSGVVTLADLDRVWLRHQAIGPFRLDYDGRVPMIVFLFTAARPRGGGPPCPKGAFSLLVPGQPRQLESAEPVETLTVAFEPALASGPLALPAEAPRKATDPGVRAIAHEIRRVMLREGEAALDYLEHLADSLIVRALQVRALPVRAAASGPVAGRAAISPFNLRRVREHVDSRLSERITVSELAAVAGLSRAYFTRAFHTETGESPHGFILARRLAEVRRRLDEGADDLARLAVQTGFSSHAHMTTAFGQAFGMTPRDYRDRRLMDRAANDLDAPDQALA